MFECLEEYTKYVAGISTGDERPPTGQIFAEQQYQRVNDIKDILNPISHSCVQLFDKYLKKTFNLLLPELKN